MKGTGNELLDPLQRQALSRAMQETYLEIFPSPSIEQRLDILAPGSYLAVTCSPSKGVEETLDLSERLVKRGFRVVPHVAARMVRDPQHLAGIISRISGLGIDSLFVPGGDAPRPLGRYATALQLLTAIAELDHGLRHIGVAAHPEGHPAVSASVLLEDLAAKQSVATYLVTQMCFDANAIVAWLREIRAHGITLPAWIGLPGVFDRGALLAASLRIGVGPSLRMLRNRGRLIGRLMAAQNYQPDYLSRALAPQLLEPQLGISGFHLFCFNQVRPSETWRLQQLASLGDPSLPGLAAGSPGSIN